MKLRVRLARSYGESARLVGREHATRAVSAKSSAITRPRVMHALTATILSSAYIKRHRNESMSPPLPRLSFQTPTVDIQGQNGIWIYTTLDNVQQSLLELRNDLRHLAAGHQIASAGGKLPLIDWAAKDQRSNVAD